MKSKYWTAIVLVAMIFLLDSVLASAIDLAALNKECQQGATDGRAMLGDSNCCATAGIPVVARVLKG